MGEAIAYDFNHQARILCGMGRYQEARQILGKALNKYPGHYNMQWNLARTYWLEGQYDRAMRELDKAYLLDPLRWDTASARARVYILKEDYPKAEEQYRILMERENWSPRTLGINGLAKLYVLQGRFKDAVALYEQCKKDFDIDLARNKINIAWDQGHWEEVEQFFETWEPPVPSWEALLGKPIALGEVKARLHKWDEAQSILDKLNDMLSEPAKIYPLNRVQRTVLDLQGRIELEKGNYETAIGLLEQAKEKLPHIHYGGYAWFLESLARAYFMAGKLETARKEYRMITTLTEGRLDDGPIHAKSFYMLGKIAEKLGDKREARKQYTRFLDLWKNADPGLPEVEDAKARLGNL